MKIGFYHIIREHFSSLVDEGNKRLSIMDIVIFFVVPTVIGGTAVYLCFHIEKDFFGISVSVFSVFAALLLNTQIAVFSIFGRNWRSADDERTNKDIQKRRVIRNELIKEINSNISYLILISIFSLILFCTIYTIVIPFQLETFATIFIYCHFTLTAMMVVKRSHALFSNEYDTK